jgi:hypothetical protein
MMKRRWVDGWTNMKGTQDPPKQIVIIIELQQVLKKENVPCFGYRC